MNETIISNEVPPDVPLTPPEEKKNNNIWIIVIVVVLVLCCCCVCLSAFSSYAWFYGDQWFGFGPNLPALASVI